MEEEHITVLLNEAVDALNIQADGIYVDGTFGRGGHSRLIAQKLSTNGCLVVFDKDPVAIAAAREWAKTDTRIKVIHEGFAQLKEGLNELGIKAIDGALFDLGVSSPQIDTAERGFSFRFDAPLDMRMDTTRGQTAAQWLNTADEDEISLVIRDYGEERFHRKIAAEIVTKRTEKPLSSTAELANICTKSVRTREKGQHAATRTFQAIRIFINRELDELESVLPQVVKCLKTNGRLVVISFHSLEDRKVKQFIKKYSSTPEFPKWAMIRQDELPTPPIKPEGKAIRATEAEIRKNPRSRSAILRVAKRTNGAWDE